MKLRTRRLDPGFFTNEQLGHLSFQARLLFAGLWCLADREGRLEDRPAQIKARLFPYDDPGTCDNRCDELDVDSLLNELQQGELLVRYEIEGQPFIALPTFLKYQKPHKEETKSLIPVPPSKSVIRRLSVRRTNVERTSNEGDLVLDPVLDLDPVLGNKEKHSCRSTNDDSEFSVEQWVSLYNEFASKNGWACLQSPGTLAPKIRARLRDAPGRDRWRKVFEKVAGWNWTQDWKVTPRFMVKTDTFERAESGEFDPKKADGEDLHHPLDPPRCPCCHDLLVSSECTRCETGNHPACAKGKPVPAKVGAAKELLKGLTAGKKL